MKDTAVVLLRYGEKYFSTYYVVLDISKKTAAMCSS
jgi:hypothetical protein